VTCIVGLVAPDRSVWIGGDSAGIDGYDLVVRADEKVFAVGPYVFGFCDSFRTTQLIRYAFRPPAPSVKNLPKFMATRFVDSVRKCLTDGGVAFKRDGVEQGGTFLVGVRGRLFCVEADYQVGENEHEFAAIGCGAQIANGAMFAQPKTVTPKTRILQALRAAERFSGGVRAPFRVVVSKG
jgi:hypothetical protein